MNFLANWLLYCNHYLYIPVPLQHRLYFYMILSEITYFNLLWSRVDSLSSSVSHSCHQTRLPNGHPTQQESSSVVIQSLPQGAAEKSIRERHSLSKSQITKHRTHLVPSSFTTGLWLCLRQRNRHILHTMAPCNLCFTVTLNTWSEHETGDRHNEFGKIRCAFTQHSSPDIICQVLPRCTKPHQTSHWRNAVSFISQQHSGC